MNRSSLRSPLTRGQITMSHSTANAYRRPAATLAFFVLIVLILLGSISLHVQEVSAQSSVLTVEPITWNVIGLDSNDPPDGPKNFPVGARVCSTQTLNNVDVTMTWESANAFIDFRPGSQTTLNFATIAAGTCVDAYFEVEVDQVSGAFDTTREYLIYGYGWCRDGDIPAAQRTVC